MELNVNIDHIATVRNARGGNDPDPVEAALIAQNAGADGIVCHLREDRRHIKDDDVIRMKEKLSCKLDLEMALADDIIELALNIKPDLVTLVPEKREELTTEGGLDVFKISDKLIDLTNQMHENRILVSLFVEPDFKVIEKSKEIGVDLVEIHTGPYANNYTINPENFLNQIIDSAKFAKSLGLRVAAGHGLNYSNTHLIASIKEIDELSIGHAIISYSLFHGIEKATKDMIRIIKNAD